MEGPRLQCNGRIALWWSRSLYVAHPNLDLLFVQTLEAQWRLNNTANGIVSHPGAKVQRPTGDWVDVRGIMAEYIERVLQEQSSKFC